jgi:Glycosyl hydrolases family 28/Pectate lyase superfamily protein
MQFIKLIPALFAILLRPLQLYPQTSPPPGVCDVRAFGAKGDGVALDTTAINKAILTCAQAGGGTVVFHPGTYLTGTIDLLSNITLQLDAGATIEGSPNLADYRKLSDYAMGRDFGVNSSGEGLLVGIIVARDAHDVAIVGRGTIDGQGDAFMDLDTPHVGADYDSKYTRNPAAFEAAVHNLQFGPVRPKEQGNGRPGTMIIFSHCKNVLVRDVTLRAAPNWTLHLQNTEQATLSGLHIQNDLRIPNNDGIDCIHCRFVHISDNDIQAGDDDLAIFGSEHVNVTNCSLVSRSAAIRLESTRNSTFDNLSIDSNRGIGIFHSANSGDSTASVLFSNISMRTRLIGGHWWGKAEPIYIAVSPCAPTECKGGVHDVTFSNISAEAESGILIYGAENDMVTGLTLDRIRLKIAAPDPDLAAAVGGNFDLRWTARNLQEAIFKHETPALYCRWVEDFRVTGLELQWGEGLPEYFSDGVECEQFRNIAIDHFEGREAHGAAALSFSNGSDLSVTGSTAAPGTATFLKLNGVTDLRSFVNYDLSAAKQAVEPPQATFHSSTRRPTQPKRNQSANQQRSK